MHSASPEQFDVPRAAAWHVHTTDGLIVSGPHDTEDQAKAAGNEFAADLRASMRRENYSEAKIKARVAALRVGYGLATHPNGWFEPV